MISMLVLRIALHVSSLLLFTDLRKEKIIAWVSVNLLINFKNRNIDEIYGTPVKSVNM